MLHYASLNQSCHAYSIADNRLTENSTWDDRLLGEIFQDLATLDLDFSLEIQPELAGRVFSRNQLMNDNAEWYLDHSQETTDILHEYFVSREHAGEFLAAAREIIRKHNEDLLNVTVRDVKTHHDTFLSYATEDMLAFVMFFSQPRTPAGESEMQAMTQELVGAALEAEGRYYLPYRLHPSAAQFRWAYPQAEEFFSLKRHYDPQELFQNEFYRKYGSN